MSGADIDAGYAKEFRDNTPDYGEGIVDHERRSGLLHVATDLFGVCCGKAHKTARDRKRCGVCLLQRILGEEVEEDTPGTFDLWPELAMREYVRCNAAAGQAENQRPQTLEVTLFRHAEEGDGAPTGVKWSPGAV